MAVGVGGGVSWGSEKGQNGVDYFGNAPNWMYYNNYSPLAQLLMRSMGGGNNQGALADLLLNGKGFGRSRRFDMYDQYPDGVQTQPGNPQPTGNASPKVAAAKKASAQAGGLAGGGQKTQVGGDTSMNLMASGLPSNRPDWAYPDPGGVGDTYNGSSWSGGAGAEGNWGNDSPSQSDSSDNTAGPGWGVRGDTGATGGGGGDAGGDGGGSITQIDYGPGGNPNYNFWDDSPDEGAGLLGAINNYGAYNDIDNRLKNDLGWQAGGDLMDLENQEKGLWDQFGKQNRLESATEDAIGWQRSGDLSDLEQQEKWGWNDVKGPGQYDQLRGDTLTGMVKNPGLSASEKASRLGAQTLPVQQALEAQQRQGDIRQAATGNAAGRWGASNAAALNAAAQNAQAGRDVETAAADYMRKDRAEGLGGLGSLQGQIDARKVQGVTGLSNLAGKQRANQQFGIQAGMGLNEQQRGAQSQAAQGIGNLGQRQRANTQWGLGALSDFNKNKQGQQLQGIGLKKDLYDTTLGQENKDLDRATQIASLVSGGTMGSSGSGGNVGVSV